MRLKEIEKEGLIECIEKKKSPPRMIVLWMLIIYNILQNLGLIKYNYNFRGDIFSTIG